MTIAVGMPCVKGAIIAADTQIAIGDAAQKASKLPFFKGKSGAFAIAFASDDVNATRTLINRIKRKLEIEPCGSPIELEALVCSAMAEWSAALCIRLASSPNGIILASRLQMTERGSFFPTARYISGSP